MNLKKATDPIIFALSGWAFSAYIFDRMHQNSFAIQVISYDHLPWHSLQAISSYVAIQLPDQSILLGWSMGGLIAIDVAHRYPNKVNKLILLNSQPYFLQDEHWFGIQYRFAERFFNKFCMNSHKALQYFYRLVFYPCMRDEFKIYASTETTHLLSLLKILFATDLRQAYQSLHQDIIHIMSSDDAILDENVSHLLKLKPDVSVTVLDQVGHAGFVHQPTLYTSVIKEFINAASD